MRSSLFTVVCAALLVAQARSLPQPPTTPDSQLIGASAGPVLRQLTALEQQVDQVMDKFSAPRPQQRQDIDLTAEVVTEETVPEPFQSTIEKALINMAKRVDSLTASITGLQEAYTMNGIAGLTGSLSNVFPRNNSTRETPEPTAEAIELQSIGVLENDKSQLVLATEAHTKIDLAKKPGLTFDLSPIIPPMVEALLTPNTTANITEEILLAALPEKVLIQVTGLV